MSPDRKHDSAGESGTGFESGSLRFDSQTPVDRHASTFRMQTPSDQSTRTANSEPRSTAELPLASPLRIGNYEIREEIARGGMGVVYKAWQAGVNRFVALKMTLAGQFAGDDERRRFRAEAEAAGQLQHPHIVPIYDVGEHEGQPYFSMGYVEGTTLKSLVANGPLPSREAALLLQTISQAVEYAHSQGVIHRDLKPSNVMIDATGQPRVTDFGLAKRTATDSSLTATGQILGTPSFMPPEQALGKLDRIGPWSDVYSLGAMLYCLLTGRPPFQAATVVDTLLQVVEQEPVPLRKLNPKVPADLETVCLKCLQKSPSQRYASAQALADELGRWLRNEPIQARPIGRIERLWRWCRRNRTVAALSSAALVLLITVAALYAVSGHRERKLEAEKDRLAISEREERKNSAKQKAENDQARTQSLVESLLNASPHTTADAILALKPLQDLAVPLLKKQVDNAQATVSQRLHAAMALMAFGERPTTRLINAIPTASDNECQNLATALRYDREAALAEIHRRLTELAESMEILRPPSPRFRNGGFYKEFGTQDNAIQARLAIIALALGDPRTSKSLSARGEDPVPRRIFHEVLANWHPNIEQLTERIQDTNDPALTSAFCIALGRVDPAVLTKSEHWAGAHFLENCLTRDPDSGTHGAARWALSQWNIAPPAQDAGQLMENRNWYVNRLGMTMIRIPAGRFEMGGLKSGDTKKSVTIEHEFFLCDQEVSIRDFREFMKDPEVAETEKLEDRNWEASDVSNVCPIRNVSTNDAVRFCNWLSRREGRTPFYAKADAESNPAPNGAPPAANDVAASRMPHWVPVPLSDGYRLPTETEWEYACRAGTSTDYCYGNLESPLGQYAVFDRPATEPCGSRIPNAWGLFDMHGNVAEWCWIERLPVHSVPPRDADEGRQVSRGGSYRLESVWCMSPSVLEAMHDARYFDIGFRIASGPTVARADSAATAEIPETPGQTESTPSRVVRLISPLPNAALSNGTRDFKTQTRWSFDWEDVPNAKAYHLHVTKDGAAVPLLNRTGIPGSAMSMISTGYVPPSGLNDWSWKVRAFVNGRWSDWSESRPFNIALSESDAPPVAEAEIPPH